MLIIPAIDLKDGHCVRLKQGVMEGATVFSKEPSEMATHWLNQGARRLHLVDLNGAFAGKPRNEAAIRDIVQAIDDRIPIQLGGGIRDLDTIERYLDSGILHHHRYRSHQNSWFLARCLQCIPRSNYGRIRRKRR